LLPTIASSAEPGTVIVSQFVARSQLPESTIQITGAAGETTAPIAKRAQLRTRRELIDFGVDIKESSFTAENGDRTE